MSDGSIGYYNSSSVLTELIAGNESDVLTISSSIPSWSAGAGSTWTEAADVTLTGIGQLSTGIITAYTQLDVWCFGANTTSQNTAITFNDSTSNYKNNQWIDDTYASDAGSSELPILGSNSTDPTFIHLSIWNPASGEIGYKWDGVQMPAGAYTPISLSGWGKYYGGQITQIDKSQYGNVSIDQAIGARIVVFGAN